MVAYVAALILFFVIFVVSYFGVAALGGVVCGFSLRFALPGRDFSCKLIPQLLSELVYYLFIFGGAASVPILRKWILRRYRLTCVRADAP